MQSLQESFDSAKDGSGVPAHKQNTRSSIIIKKKTKPTKMKYQSYAPPYHPSLQSTSTTSTNNATHQLTNKKLQPLQLPTLQSNYINAKMNELRNLAANANKRQKKVNDHQRSTVVESVTSLHNCNSITSSDGFDMLEELDTQPNVVQIVATSGGMITHWNESFTKLIKQPSSSSSSSCPQDTTTNNNLPLTIFELVDSKSLPSLYSMLAMALHNVSIVDVEDFTLVEEEVVEEEVVEEEEVVGDKRKRTAAKEDDATSSSSSHLSITLPCKSFHGTRTRYNITVVFMNDTTSMKRSFLGILTPRRGRSTSSSSQDDDASSSSTITSCSSSSVVPKVTTSEKDTTEDDEQDTQDICKALKKEEEEEYATSSPSCNVRQLPRDKIIRVNDKLLCRMLLGSC